jgi:capsid protein
MLKSILPPGYDDDGGPEEEDEFKTFPVDNGMMTVLPAGYDATQMRPEQPQAQFDSFTEKLIAEACRVLDIPLNLALGTSQKFNFSSARLDHINYRGGKRVERSQCDKICLRKVYVAFVAEGSRIPKYFDAQPSNFNETNCPHKWFWPGFEPLDPKGDSEADAQRLASGQITADEYYAEQGKDWEDIYKQLALEDKARKKLGLQFGLPGKPDPNDDPTLVEDTTNAV